ncbi:MAG: JDVT-CTERM domain-containing protein, partial [Gammaproteobacteria bacterium]
LVVWGGDDDTAPLVDNEYEIFGQRIDGATGVELGTNDFRISDMGPDGFVNYRADDPAVAWNETDNEYLVVWRGDDDTGLLVDDEVEIYTQRIDGATGAEVGTNDFRISDMGSTDGVIIFGASDPAVAWNATDDEYLVVWRGDDDTGTLVDNEFEIFGQRITATTGAEAGINDFRITDMGPQGNVSFTADNPAVTWNAAANEYLVVWEGDDDTGPLVDDEFEIFGRRLNSAGSQLGTTDVQFSDMGIGGDANFDAFSPGMAYNPMRNEFLVVWSGDDDTGPLVDDESEIFGQLFSAIAVVGGGVGGGSGGGCTLNQLATAYDPTLPLLILFAMGYLLLRRMSRGE